MGWTRPEPAGYGPDISGEGTGSCRVPLHHPRPTHEAPMPTPAQYLALSVVVLTTACGPANEKPCTPGELVSTNLPDGSTGVPLDALLEVEVSGGAGPVEVWVDGGGTDGWVAATGAVPLSLLPGQVHTVVISQCDTILDTAVVETPALPVQSDFYGPTWAVDMYDNEVTWTSPPSRPPESVIDSMVGQANLFLLHLTHTAEPRLHMAFGESIADEALQWNCAMPGDISADVSADPRLTAGPEDLVMTEGDYEYAYRELEVTAELDAETGHLIDVRTRFALDLRALPGNSGTDNCAFLAALDAACVPCPDQASDTDDPACAPFDLTWPVARHHPELTFDPSPLEGPSC